MRATLNFSALILISVFVTGTAQAHIRMISPKPRLDVDNLKTNSPADQMCANQLRGNTPYIYEPAQSVPIQFQETINHPGRFIVQFSPANDVGFTLPENELARLEDTMAGGMRTITVRMPNVECTTCTLRVVQVMDDQPGQLYVHCIDINLRRAAVPTPTPGGGGNGGLGTGNDPSNATEQKFGGYGCGTIGALPPGGPGAGSGSMVASLLLMFLTLLTYAGLRKSQQSPAYVQKKPRGYRA
jgi:hypothetical protein